MSKTRPLLLLAVAALLTAACGSDAAPPAASSSAAAPSVTASAGEPTPQPPAATATPGVVAPVSDACSLFFGDRVPADQRVLIQSTLNLTATYLIAAAAAEPVPCQVFAVEDLTSLEAVRRLLGPEDVNLPLDMIARRLRFISAEAYLDNIFINTSSPYWQGLSDLARMRAVSHEYFHVLQMNLMGQQRAELIFTTPPHLERPEGPTWLFEGSAEYIGWRFAEAAGLSRFANAFDTTSHHPVTELRDLETYVDFVGDDDRLRISLRAVALLLRQRDETALTGFYRLLGFGMPWRDAFRFVFGRSIEAFYEEYRVLYG